MKSYENELKIILQYKYHHRLFWNVLHEFWQIVDNVLRFIIARKRKRTSKMCVANLHSLPWKITSMVHKIRTPLKQRLIFKRASGNRSLHDAGKTWLPRRAAAAAAAIPCQYIRGQSPTTEKKRILREDRIWTLIPGRQTWRRHYSRFSPSSMSTSTPWYTSHWRSESDVLGCCTSSIENGRVYKIPKLIGKKIHVWGLVALLLPQKLQICKLGDIRAIRRPEADYSTKNDELRKDSSQEYNSSTPWIEHEIITLLEKLDWGQKRKELKEGVRDVHTRTEGRQTFSPQWSGVQFVSTTMPAKQKKLQIQRNRGRWIINFIDDLSKMQSTEFTCPQRRNEFWQTQSKPSLRTSLYAGRMCCKSGQRKMEKNIVRKTTYASKGPDVTLRNTWGHKNSDVVSMPRETERILQTWDFDPISSESRNWPNEEFQGQAVHAKNWRFFSSRWSWSVEC